MQNVNAAAPCRRVTIMDVANTFAGNMLNVKHLNCLDESVTHEGLAQRIATPS